MNLLQQLNQLQEEHGWLPEAALRAFSEESGTPLYEIQAVASFYPHYRLQAPPRCHVTVCRDMTCHLFGAPELLDRVESGLVAHHDVEVESVSCLGRCEHAPAATVDDVPLLGWDADRIVAAAKGEVELPPD